VPIYFQVLGPRIPISVCIGCREVVNEHPMVASLVSMKKGFVLCQAGVVGCLVNNNDSLSGGGGVRYDRCS